MYPWSAWWVWTLVLRRPQARLVGGQPEGGYTDSMSSSAAIAVTILSWITSRSPRSSSGCAARTRSPQAWKRTSSTPGSTRPVGRCSSLPAGKRSRRRSCGFAVSGQAAVLRCPRPKIRRALVLTGSFTSTTAVPAVIGSVVPRVGRPFVASWRVVMRERRVAAGFGVGLAWSGRVPGGLVGGGPFGAGLVAEGGDGGFQGRVEVAGVDRAGQAVAFDLGRTGSLSSANNQAGALGVQCLVEVLQQVRYNGAQLMLAADSI